jgi:predicted house-cleaning noncanonical NTP pyrophosphatase (MazG superfamily)
VYQLDSWRELTDHIKIKIHDAIVQHVDSSIDAKRAMQDKEDEHPWRRLVSFDHGQQQSILMSAATKISSDAPFRTFVTDLNRIMDANLDRTTKNIPPKEKLERVDTLVKESSEAAAALLSRYPYKLMKPSMMRAINHQLPPVVRRHLWNSSCYDKQLRDRAIAFMSKLNVTGSEYKTDPGIIRVADAACKKVDTILKDQHVLSEAILMDYDVLLHNVFLFAASATHQDSNADANSLLFQTKILDMGTLSIPIISTYGTDDVETKYRTRRDAFYAEKMMTVYRMIHSLEKAEYVNKTLELLQVKDADIITHISSLVDERERARLVEGLLGEMVKSVRSMFVGVLELPVTLFLWDQIIISEFDTQMVVYLLTALLMLVREPILACNEMRAITEVLATNNKLVTVEALTGLLQKEFIRDIQQYYQIQIFPKDIIDIRGMEDQKAKLLFSQQSDYLGVPDSYQTRKGAQDNDPKSVNYLWNDIWAHFDKKIYRDIVFEGKRYTILLLPRRVYKQLSCIEELVDHTIIYGNNKDSYLLAARLGKEAQYKHALQQCLLEQLAEYQQDESNTDLGAEVIATLSRHAKYIEDILSVPFKLSISDVKFDLRIDLKKLETGDIENELQMRLNTLDTKVDPTSFQEAILRAKLEYGNEMDQYKKLHEKARKTSFVKPQTPVVVEKEEPPQDIIQQYKSTAHELFSKAVIDIREGADLFFKGTEQEQAENGKLAYMERDTRKLRLQVLGQEYSSYEYGKLKRKDRDKFDKMIEKEVKKVYNNMLFNND